MTSAEDRLRATLGLPVSEKPKARSLSPRVLGEYSCPSVEAMKLIRYQGDKIRELEANILVRIERDPDPEEDTLP